jgi:hypothetical protein
MRPFLSTLLLVLSGVALAGPWLPGTDADPTDAVAQAPDGEVRAVVVDLAAVRSGLEDSVRRVLQDKADPIQAMIVPIDPVPETTAAELRGLLDGSGAHTARLDALSTRWVFYRGESAVLQATAVVRPDASTTLLRLTVDRAPATPIGPPVAMPGGLGVTWSKAQAALTRAIRDGRCDGLPLASDELLATLVPPPFLATTTQARNAAAPARAALCAAAAATEWDRLEMHAAELHFNLFDRGGALRGGLELRAVPETAPPVLSYPMFKRLPDPP